LGAWQQANSRSHCLGGVGDSVRQSWWCHSEALICWGPTPTPLGQGHKTVSMATPTPPPLSPDTLCQWHSLGWDRQLAIFCQSQRMGQVWDLLLALLSAACLTPTDFFLSRGAKN